MYLLMYLLVGFLCGWIASVILDHQSMSATVRDVSVGIVGALFGGFFFDFVGPYSLGFWDSVGTSIVGSVLFLVILSMFFHPKKGASKHV